jgi:YegS/Rv2252/BmrU family lipid kinase
LTKKRIIFIVNPISGGSRKDQLVNQIDTTIDKNKYHSEMFYTDGPGHATEICREQAKNQMDIVVAVGGDGSVNEVAKGLIGSDTALGIIPAGSGNGLAHHLKIPVNPKKALEIINGGKTLKIDTGSINKELFVSIAGIGFDGLVAYRFSQDKRRGFLAYARIVAEEYPNYKPRKYKIQINGKTIKTRALFIGFANSDQFGYNTTIAPHAKIDDGLLDIIIMQKPSIIEIPLLANLLYWRMIDKWKNMKIIKASELTVEMRKKRWVNVDGEPMVIGKKLNIKVNPQSLNILVP